MTADHFPDIPVLKCSGIRRYVIFGLAGFTYSDARHILSSLAALDVKAGRPIDALVWQTMREVNHMHLRNLLSSCQFRNGVMGRWHDDELTWRLPRYERSHKRRHQTRIGRAIDKLFVDQWPKFSRY